MVYPVTGKFIHGGGIDLIFPHHENEVAQSEGAGKKFARYWIHHGLLTINGQKMAKSLGNFITIKDLLVKHSADVLKLFYLQAHYSSPIDFTWERLEEAYRATLRFEMLFHRTEHIRKAGITNITKTADFIEKNKNSFIQAMDDDFNTPDALASIFALVNDANKFIDHKKQSADYIEIVNAAEKVLIELSGILGLELKPIQTGILIAEKEIESMIALRAKAKSNKDYVLADKIRKTLEDKGIILEDTKDGPTWRRKF
jgi:cysteinyl-tRNA synthetase